MFIKANDPRIRYTGRWNVTEESAASSANGNYMEFAFRGDTAVVAMDVSKCQNPPPHLFISVDNGARVEVPADAFVRVSTEPGEHTVKVIMKSSVESQTRWCEPIEAMVRITALEADAFTDLPEDNRKIIEFLGDSITEGISIDNDGRYVYWKDNRDMVYFDDSTAGYAWLTAEALDMRPIIVGYGCLGSTHGGAGGVPKAADAYPFYSDQCPVKDFSADYIVINYGTNDRMADMDILRNEYTNLLKVIREYNPKAQLISVSPFCGRLAEELEEIVNAYNTANNDTVFFINAGGWISPEPLHPTREGNRIVSRNLSAILKKQFSL
ncbi:MAG: hypothetical protein IJ325_00140 [Clostridia bacterium]|nr:hypothetical protein [Clostridia bacterium]